MAVNLSGNASLSLSAQRTNITGNLISDSWSIEDQEFDELSTQFLELVNGASDTVISLGEVGTGSLILIVSDQTISFKLNSETVAVAFKVILLSGAAVTALKLSNASGSTANVRLAVLGT